MLCSCLVEIKPRSDLLMVIIIKLQTYLFQQDINRDLFGDHPPNHTWSQIISVALPPIYYSNKIVELSEQNFIKC